MVRNLNGNFLISNRFIQRISFLEGGIQWDGVYAEIEVSRLRPLGSILSQLIAANEMTFANFEALIRSQNHSMAIWHERNIAALLTCMTTEAKLWYFDKMFERYGRILMTTVASLNCPDVMEILTNVFVNTIIGGEPQTPLFDFILEVCFLYIRKCQLPISHRHDIAQKFWMEFTDYGKFHLHMFPSLVTERKRIIEGGVNFGFHIMKTHFIDNDPNLADESMAVEE